MEEAVRHDVPVAGIRHGQLGFLATFSPEDMEAKIPALFRGGVQDQQEEHAEVSR